MDVLGYNARVFETGDVAAATDALKRHGIELLWADLPLNAARSSTMPRGPEGNLINNFLAATGCGVRACAGCVGMGMRVRGGVYTFAVNWRWRWIADFHKHF
jgi:hypothetical protein